MILIREQDTSRKEFKLKSWLWSKMPQAKNLQITRFEKTASGTSNETYYLTARWQEAREEKEEQLVIRWAPETMPLLHTYDLMMQFRVMKNLGDSDVPVPKMYWYEEDEEVLGAPFFVMEFIDGEVPDGVPRSDGSNMLYKATKEERSHIWHQTVEAIAKIHSVDWKSLGLSFLRGSGGGIDSLDQEIAWWEDLLVFSEAQVPVLIEAFDWIKGNKFAPSRVCLCWGDARPGNLIFRDHKVVGVVDWEMAYIGPPECDVFYLCVMDEMGAQIRGISSLVGMLGMEETIGYYECRTGRKMEHLLYHEVFATLKSAVGFCRAGKLMEEAGIEGLPPGLFTNNAATQRLEKLLGKQNKKP